MIIKSVLLRVSVVDLETPSDAQLLDINSDIASTCSFKTPFLSHTQRKFKTTQVLLKKIANKATSSDLEMLISECTFLKDIVTLRYICTYDFETAYMFQAKFLVRFCRG